MSNPHQRSVIRAHLVALLQASNTLAGDRVHDNPTRPRATLPALTVVDVGEAQDNVGGRGATRSIQRQLVLEVTAEIKQSGDHAAQRDQLCGEAEAALATAVGTVPGVRLVLPMGWSADAYTDGEQTISLGRQRFQVTYITTQGDPTAIH